MNARVEFGDFQTPDRLCDQVCDMLARSNQPPASIIEPTCGKGSFLRSASRIFPECTVIQGFELNPVYADEAASTGVPVSCADFFATDWKGVFTGLTEPILVIGNPPWVTNSTVSSMKGSNLPEKANFMKMKGMDAITGKSNFDISEWMLSHILKTLSGRVATLAMLCKTTVARKVLLRGWGSDIPIEKASMWSIDALRYFGASVDACLFVCTIGKGETAHECAVYSSFDADAPSSVLVMKNGRLILSSLEVQSYDDLDGKSPLKWRSGVKHDCSKVMELRSFGSRFQNGLGEPVEIESAFVYPMLKGSDLGKSEWPPFRHMLVTQKFVGEDTSKIANKAPLTWRYLQAHSQYLDRRASVIYRNRPRFSAFGVGHYAFAPWKVAISGFYKRLNFRVVGPVGDKPVVLDDTCYFLPFSSKIEAESVAEMLHSEPAQCFLKARIFWDSKRPITSSILQSLNLGTLSTQLGVQLPKSYEA